MRKKMVEELSHHKVIYSNNVYNAMLKVPRHKFLPESVWNRAYIDSPLPIGNNQTISAPHMNAMMCQYLELAPNQKVLEVGTGSGYHAALLAELVGPNGHVFTLERFPELAEHAKQILQLLGYKNVSVITGDGTSGYPSQSPFDRILVTAAGPKVPPPLLSQLSQDGGILCIPIGERSGNQDLFVIKRNQDEYIYNSVCKVVFVPLVGKFGYDDPFNQSDQYI